MSATLALDVADGIALLAPALQSPPRVLDFFGTSLQDFIRVLKALKRDNFVWKTASARFLGLPTRLGLQAVVIKSLVALADPVGTSYAYLSRIGFKELHLGVAESEYQHKQRSVRKNAPMPWGIHLVRKLAEPDFTSRAFFANLDYRFLKVQLPQGFEVARDTGEVLSQIPESLRDRVLQASRQVWDTPIDLLFDAMLAFRARWLLSQPDVVPDFVDEYRRQLNPKVLAQNPWFVDPKGHLRAEVGRMNAATGPP
jgi:hypothetical protein